MEEEEKSKSLAKLKNKHEAMITDLEGERAVGGARWDQEPPSRAGLGLGAVPTGGTGRAGEGCDPT